MLSADALILLSLTPLVLCHVRFATDSVFGKSIPCTKEEKLCLSFSMVYDHLAGRCMFLQDDCFKREGKKYFINKTELLTEEGSLQIVCKTAFCEDTNKYSTADGQCLTKEEIARKCGEKYSTNIYGETECESVKGPWSQSARQPLEEGRCVVPNFTELVPLYYPDLDGALYNPNCSGFWEVLYNGTCYPALSKGPCPDGQRLVLDKATFEGTGERRAECAPAKCALPSDVWMRASERCHRRGDLWMLPDCLGAVEDNFGEGYCSRVEAASGFQSTSRLICPAGNSERCPPPVILVSPRLDFGESL